MRCRRLVLAIFELVFWLIVKFASYFHEPVHASLLELFQNVGALDAFEDENLSLIQVLSDFLEELGPSVVLDMLAQVISGESDTFVQVLVLWEDGRCAHRGSESLLNEELTFVLGLTVWNLVVL